MCDDDDDDVFLFIQMVFVFFFFVRISSDRYDCTWTCKCVHRVHRYLMSNVIDIPAWMQQTQDNCNFNLISRHPIDNRKQSSYHCVVNLNLSVWNETTAQHINETMANERQCWEWDVHACATLFVCTKPNRILWCGDQWCDREWIEKLRKTD